MIYTKFSLQAALEEFHQELDAGISEQTVPEVEVSPEAVEEAQSFDQDFEQFATVAQALEDIVALVEDTPEEDNQPLSEPFRKAINIALEDLDTSVEQGEKKSEVINKMKEKASTMMKAMAEFAARVLQWIKEKWAAATDKVVRAGKRAEAALGRLKTTQLSESNKVTGPVAKAAVVTEGSFAQAITKVMTHVQNCGDRDAVAITTHVLDAVDAAAAGEADKARNSITEALKASAQMYEGEGTAEQANAAGVEGRLLVTGPFLGGYSAWSSAPETAEDANSWKHGLSKLAEPPEGGEEIASLNSQDAAVVCRALMDMASRVGNFRAALGAMDKLAKTVQKQVSAAGRGVEKNGEIADLFSKLNQIIPKAMKGPQVNALNYAGTAANIAAAYVEASLKAAATPAPAAA